MLTDKERFVEYNNLSKKLLKGDISKILISLFFCEINYFVIITGFPKFRHEV